MFVDASWLHVGSNEVCVSFDLLRYCKILHRAGGTGLHQIEGEARLVGGSLVLGAVVGVGVSELCKACFVGFGGGEPFVAFEQEARGFAVGWSGRLEAFHEAFEDPFGFGEAVASDEATGHPDHAPCADAKGVVGVFLPEELVEALGGASFASHVGAVGELELEEKVDGAGFDGGL